MRESICKIKVPAKIMIAGEYVALRGYPVISSTIDRYFEFYLYPNTSLELKIKSSFYGREVVFKNKEDILKIESNPLRETLLWVLDQGVDIFRYEIEEKFSGNARGGWGSSSALIQALIYLFMHKSLSRDEILYESYNIQRRYQGDCSGYDFVTQRFGGIVEFKRRMDAVSGVDFYSKQSIEDRVDINKYIHVFSCSVGDNTKNTIRSTISYLKEDCTRFDSLVEISIKLHLNLKEFILLDRDSFQIDDKLKDIYKLVDEQQSIFWGLDNYPKIIGRIKTLDGYMDRFTIKTTGSGGYDSLLVFGKDQDIKEVSSVMKQAGWSRIEGIFCKQGIEYGSMG